MKSILIIPNIIFIILIGINTIVITFLTTNGKLTDERYSAFWRKINRRGKLVILSLLMMLCFLIAQEFNNQNINNKTLTDLNILKEKQDSAIATGIKSGVESSNKKLFQDLSAAFANQGLKIDTLKKTVNQIEEVKAISEQLTIANSPTILEIKYIIPLNKFDIRERNELAENLILNFNTALTIYRKEKQTNNLIAEFIGSSNQFTKIPLHQAQSFPTNFSKENAYIVYPPNPDKDKDNYHITVYIKLLPSELNSLRGLNNKDKVNLVKTKRIENKILTPLNSRMYNAELKIKDCSILIGTKKINLKPLENVYINYEPLLPQIIHMFEVE